MIREIYIEPTEKYDGGVIVPHPSRVPSLDIFARYPKDNVLIGTITGREKLEQLKAMIEEMLKT